MKLPSNRPLRNLGIYKLQGQTLVLLKRTEELSFLFQPEKWNFHGPVAYRVSHGDIYLHGDLTTLTDADLIDTGMTANPPNPLRLIAHTKI